MRQRNWSGSDAVEAQHRARSVKHARVEEEAKKLERQRQQRKHCIVLAQGK